MIESLTVNQLLTVFIATHVSLSILFFGIMIMVMSKYYFFRNRRRSTWL